MTWVGLTWVVPLALALSCVTGCNKRPTNSQLAAVEIDPDTLQQLCTHRCHRKQDCTPAADQASSSDCPEACVVELANDSPARLAAHDRCLQLGTCTAFDECEASLGPVPGGARLAFRSAESPCIDLCRELADCEPSPACSPEDDCPDPEPTNEGSSESACIQRCHASGINVEATRRCLAEQGCDGQVSCILTSTTTLAQGGAPGNATMPGVDPACTQYCDRALSCSHEVELAGTTGAKRRRATSRSQSSSGEPPATSAKEPAETPELSPELTGARVECGLQCTRELALNGPEQISACLALPDCHAFLDCASEL